MQRGQQREHGREQDDLIQTMLDFALNTALNNSTLARPSSRSARTSREDRKVVAVALQKS